MAEGGPSGSGEAPIVINDDEADINLDVEPAGMVNKLRSSTPQMPGRRCTPGLQTLH